MKKIILLSLLFVMNYSFAQRITREQYIELYKDLAIREMKRMGVPAAITLAQGLLETEGGNSELLKKSNNHFGIKCKDTWSAGGVSHDDDAKGECFRVYKNAEESYRDHSNFLRSRAWYAPLFKLNPADYKGWAYGLKKAGYATNPLYPQILIKFIEENNLHQYDLLALSDVPHYDASKYTDDPEDKAITEVVSKISDSKNRTIIIPDNSIKTEITINKTRAVWVPGGKSLLAVATEHHLNLDKLLEYNDLDKDGIVEKDQYIFLERKGKEGETDTYNVAENEGLWDIAQKTGIRLQKLLEYNKLGKSDHLQKGKILVLNSSSRTISTSSSSPEIKIHRVAAHEGLYTISKKYGVSIIQIKEWNSLENENLKIGQELIVSK